MHDVGPPPVMCNHCRMATSAERKALMFLGTVIALGGGMRVVGASNSGALADKASRQAIDAQIAAVDSARRAGSGFGKRKGKGRRPKKPAIIAPAIVDIDIASADEIETLRWVGPALAARIVADRDSLGPFGSLRELERVRGNGPALAAKLDSTVTFSLVPRPSTTESTRSSEPAKRRRKPRPGDANR